MVQDIRPVSILGVGFAGVATARRRWPYALAVLVAPLAALLGVMGLSRLFTGVIPPVVGAVLLAGALLLSLALAQLAALHSQLGPSRLRNAASSTGWISDIGRQLLLTVVWLLAAVILQLLLYEACETSGLNAKAWAEPGIAAGSLFLLALPLVAMGFAAAPAFAERHWAVWRRPPAWPDLWRILLGYAVVAAQLGALWWGAVAGFSWLARAELIKALSYTDMAWLRLAGLGLALGLSMLCIAPAWAQAWRQSLGRPTQDLASVFD